MADQPVVAQEVATRVGDWPNYGNDPGGMRFSALTQINRENVSELKTAWVYHTGDLSDGRSGPRTGFETTPSSWTTPSF